MTIASRLVAALADRYHVDRELGQGGMATVYLAEDLKHKRKVALKVLKPELAAVLGADRFVQEITTTAALQHPHILPLFDSGEADGFLYYVMPFIDGETLRAKLDRETQLGVDESVKLAVAVADALDYAHRRGVIHRDIKPENILLHEGRPMVADFGIALALSAAAGGRMTETGLSLGTPHYMSPEQATAEKDISARSDVYSLATVLYEMLAGQPPHLGGSAQQIIMKIITETPQPVTTLRKSVPANVAAALSTALEKLAADRFDSARAFADALQNPAYAGPGSIARRAERRSPWNGLTVGALVVAAASLLFAVAAARRDVQPSVERGSVVRFALDGDPDNHILTGATAPFGVSEDGNSIVYTASDSGGRELLWVRTADNAAPRMLLGTEGGVHPSVSPDGEWVAFITGVNRLKKVRLSGGSVTDLADMPGVTRSLNWLSNDAILCEIIAPNRELYRVPAAGGRATIAIPLDSASHEVSQGRAVVLRESGNVIYASHRSGGRPSELAMYAPATQQRRSLGIRAGTPLGVLDGLLIVASEGGLFASAIDVAGMRTSGPLVPLSQHASLYQTGMAVALSPGGTLVYEEAGSERLLRLALVDQSGRHTLIPGTPSRYTQPRFSKDGRRVAVSIQESTSGNATAATSDVWVIDLGTGEATRATRSGTADHVEWAPDGRHLIYILRVNGRAEPWWMSLDGSTPPARLADVDGTVDAAAMLPDGHSFIAMRRTIPGDQRELLQVWTDGSKRVDTLVTPSRPDGIRARYPRLSPDGRMVAYSERNHLSVHVRRLDNNAEVQISTAGGCCAVWGPDSRHLVFRDRNSLVSVEIRTDPTLAVVQRSTRPGLADAPVDSWTAGTNYDLSPDGKTFVTTVLADSKPRVFAAHNWREELRREWRGRGETPSNGRAP